jgi:LPXTG-site transpeptidase (sortase) family protein
MKQLLLLQRVNLFLTTCIILGSLTIIASPFIPSILRKALPAPDQETTVKYNSGLADSLKLNKARLAPTPTDNRLVIPDMRLDAPVAESGSQRVLQNGIWRIPGSSTPDKGGNTVIVGHRYLYNSDTSTDTFYFLDTLKDGDKFNLFWQGKEYIYKVTKSYETEPTNIQVEQQTIEPKLTLYTCSPLWSNERRLIVEALPIKL